MATTQDRSVNNLIINELTKYEYDNLPSYSGTELYIVPEEVDSVVTQDSTNPVQSGAVYNELQNVQPKTLNTSLTINGTTVTTIEGALGALNNRLSSRMYIVPTQVLNNGLEDALDANDMNINDIAIVSNSGSSDVTINYTLNGVVNTSTITPDADKMFRYLGDYEFKPIILS